MLDKIFESLRPDEQIYVFQKSTPIRRLLFDSVEEVIEYSQKNDNYDLYFGVAPRKRNSYDVVSRLTCVYADIDGIGKDNQTEDTLSDRVATFPVKPSYVVNSGHGLHVYWLLEHDVDGAQSQKICKGIMSVISSDAVHDPERILRIPNTHNWKDPQNIVPVVMRVEKPERRYDPEDLLNLTRISLSCLKTIQTGSEQGFKTRSERDWSVLRSLVASNISERTIRIIADQRPIGERWREDNYRLLNIDLAKAKDTYSESAQKFSESNGMLFYEGSKGQHQVATFTFQPEKLLRSEDSAEDAFFGSIKTNDRLWPGIILPRSAFSSLRNFMVYMTAMEWQWLGSDFETKQYLLYLMSKCKEREITESISTYVVGRHDNYWVTKSVTIAEDQVFQPSESPYLYADRKNRRRNTVDTVPSTLYTFPEEDQYQEIAEAISRYIGKTNERINIIPMLGWFAAAPLKHIFREADIRFPILNVFGTFGSGKTSIINNILMPLIGVVDSHTNASNTTRFVLRMLLSQTNGLPVIFGEYRESSIDKQSDLHGLLRMLYDTGMDSRGHADQTTETYLLEAPVIVDGEDSLSDPALKQRSIVINLHPEAVAEDTEYYRAYKTLETYSLGDFGGRYIQHTLGYSAADLKLLFKETWDELQEEYKKTLPDRIRNNLTVVACGLKIFNKHLVSNHIPEVAWEYEDLWGCISNVIMQLSTGASRTVVDEFIEDVVSFVANPQNTRVPFICFYARETNVLWLHFSTAHKWWTREQRMRGKGILEAQALQAQLAERSRDSQNYVVPLTLIETAPNQRLQMYGIKLSSGAAVGLNIPNNLSEEVLLTRYGMTLKQPANKKAKKIRDITPLI